MKPEAMQGLDRARSSIWLLFRMHGLWFFTAAGLVAVTYLIAMGLNELVEFDEDGADAITREVAQFVIAWYMGDFAYTEGDDPGG